MKKYAFLTKDNFRVEVKASSAIAGFNKLKSIPYFDDNEITVFYYQYVILLCAVGYFSAHFANYLVGVLV